MTPAGPTHNRTIFRSDRRLLWFSSHLAVSLRCKLFNKSRSDRVPEHCGRKAPPGFKL